MLLPPPWGELPESGQGQESTPHSEHRPALRASLRLMRTRCGGWRGAGFLDLQWCLDRRIGRCPRGALPPSQVASPTFSPACPLHVGQTANRVGDTLLPSRPQASEKRTGSGLENAPLHLAASQHCCLTQLQNVLPSRVV